MYGRLAKGRMILEVHGKKAGEVPLETVQAVQLHGNVNLSSGLVRELLWRDVPIQWCSMSGRLIGWAQSSCGPNGLARGREGALPADAVLAFAQAFILAKIANQATQLRRSKCSREAADGMRVLQRQCEKVHSLQELLGIEGKAATLYFANWRWLIKEPLREMWAFQKRSGRVCNRPSECHA